MPGADAGIPVNRIQKEPTAELERKYGRVDYWAVYNDAVYFIEVKQVFVESSPSKKTWHKAAKAALDQAGQQLSCIEKSDGDDLLTFKKMNKLSFVMVMFWGKEVEKSLEPIDTTAFSEKTTMSYAWQEKGIHNVHFGVKHEADYTSKGVLFLGQVIK